MYAIMYVCMHVYMMYTLLYVCRVSTMNIAADMLLADTSVRYVVTPAYEADKTPLIARASRKTDKMPT